jgi:oxygen-independent coproporphyrinogen-3 oxidase
MLKNSTPDMPSTEPLALYIHWPFCRKKCPYCDFNSHVRETIEHEKWLSSYISELTWIQEQVNIRPLTSIFFGGGTPSLMPPELVEKLLNSAASLFGFSNEIEITLEANPTSVEAANFKALKQAGINRVSLGVQSLKDEALQFLGREHSAKEALKAVELAQSVFNRTNFDLIYALPEQTLKQWETELNEALNYIQGHASLYQLTIEPGTQFFHHHKSGKFTMPEDTLSADFYELTQEIMESHGLPAYEISNHAASGEASRHNVNYWRGGEYIGIGPGAHGRVKIENKRTATVARRSPEKWLKTVAESQHGYETLASLNTTEQIQERLMMGLRLVEGFDTTPRLATDCWTEDLLISLQTEGLINIEKNKIIPSLQGRLVLNNLKSYLLNHYAM